MQQDLQQQVQRAQQAIAKALENTRKLQEEAARNEVLLTRAAQELQDLQIIIQNQQQPPQPQPQQQPHLLPPAQQLQPHAATQENQPSDRTGKFAPRYVSAQEKEQASKSKYKKYKEKKRLEALRAQELHRDESMGQYEKIEGPDVAPQQPERDPSEPGTDSDDAEDRPLVYRLAETDVAAALQLAAAEGGLVPPSIPPGADCLQCGRTFNPAKKGPPHKDTRGKVWLLCRSCSAALHLQCAPDAQEGAFEVYVCATCRRQKTQIAFGGPNTEDPGPSTARQSACSSDL